MDTKLTWASNMPLQQRRYQHHPVWSKQICVQAELSGTRDMDILEKTQWRAMKTVKGLTHVSYIERLRELKLQSLEKRRGGILSMCTDTWWEGVKMSLSSGAQQEERDNGHRLKHRKFDLNSRKMFFTVKMARYCNTLLREVVKSSSLVTFKTQLCTYLSNLL